MKPTLEQIRTDESVWPDNATHYLDDDFRQWACDAEFTWAHKTGEWVAEHTSWSLEDYEKKGFEIIPRPAKAFVPEVGVECEFMDGEKWSKCKIDYIGEKYIVVITHDYGDYEALVKDFNHKLRPIKSEREKFSEAVDSLIKPHHWTAIDIGEALYDSGKFKLVEPTK